MVQEPVKKCLHCKKKLEGRSDKKFCDHNCRNSFNNKLNHYHEAVVQRINSNLRKNRRILQDVLQDKKSNTVSREILLQKGFKFQYHTHIENPKKGVTYFFCYEYSYLIIDTDVYQVFGDKKKK